MLSVSGGSTIMVLLIDLLSNLLKAAFEHANYQKEYGVVVQSARPDLCQFQCNGALSAAKIYKTSPLTIAENVVKHIPKNEIIEDAVVVSPGFINIVLHDKFLTQYVNSIYFDKYTGVPQAECDETIVIDYGNPNVAKPLHVGHLRSTIIGESLKRIAQATGRTVIGDVHLGDWGLPMGLVLAELEERYGDELPELTTDMLNEIYPYASQKSKTDEIFLNTARKKTSELQRGDKKSSEIWSQMVKLSVLDIKKTFDRLNAEFDYWYGESDSSRFVPQLVDTLRLNNLLVDSDGAKVVFVNETDDNVDIPPVIIIKSNGSEGYDTTDVATIIQREQDFHPNKIWYIVDHRQSLHFTQVFRVARKAKLIPDTTELTHLCFGTVNGKDGKPFKTRDGGVMQLSELLDSVAECAYNNLRVSDSIDEESQKQIAEKIGIAAIKFGDLINHYSKDCTFDIEKFMASDGKTGVYLLYVIARINSILEKIQESDMQNFCISNVYSQSERELLLTLSKTGQAFINAFNEKAPSIVCENAYQIAVAFSKFYQESHIISEVDQVKKSSWISLCVITKEILKKHLHALAIDPVEKM